MPQDSNDSALTGAKIKEIRQQSGLSQQEFGARLGVSHAHISKIESGKENPSETLLKLIGYEFSTTKIYGIPTAEETIPKIKQCLSALDDFISNSKIGDGILYNTEFMLSALITIYQETKDSEKLQELILESIGSIVDETAIFLLQTKPQMDNQGLKTLRSNNLYRVRSEITSCCESLYELLEERAK